MFHFGCLVGSKRYWGPRGLICSPRRGRWQNHPKPGSLPWTLLLPPFTPSLLLLSVASFGSSSFLAPPSLPAHPLSTPLHVVVLCSWGPVVLLCSGGVVGRCSALLWLCGAPSSRRVLVMVVCSGKCEKAVSNTRPHKGAPTSENDSFRWSRIFCLWHFKHSPRKRKPSVAPLRSKKWFGGVVSTIGPRGPYLPYKRAP